MLPPVLRDESGATAIEYALVAALVVVAILVALSALGTPLDTLFTHISDVREAAAP